MQVSCSGDQNDGGAHLRGVGSEPRRVVAVGGAGVVGNIAGSELCSCRSSGERGAVHMVQEGVKGEGEEVAGLTAITMRQTVG